PARNPGRRKDGDADAAPTESSLHLADRFRAGRQARDCRLRARREHTALEDQRPRSRARRDARLLRSTREAGRGGPLTLATAASSLNLAQRKSVQGWIFRGSVPQWAGSATPEVSNTHKALVSVTPPGATGVPHPPRSGATSVRPCARSHPGSIAGVGRKRRGC